MAKLEQQVQTKYGIVKIDVLNCDTCGAEQLPQYAVEWLQLFRLTDKDVRKTLGGLPDESHFCSRGCLTSFVS